MLIHSFIMVSLLEKMAQIYIKYVEPTRELVLILPNLTVNVCVHSYCVTICSILSLDS